MRHLPPSTSRGPFATVPPRLSLGTGDTAAMSPGGGREVGDSTGHFREDAYLGIPTQSNGTASDGVLPRSPDEPTNARADWTCFRSL